MANESTPLGVRLPDLLKDRLAACAEKHNKSLNAEIIFRLEESFRSTAKVIDEIFDAVNLGKVQRMRSTSTSADTHRILTIVKNLGTEKIILGARKDHLNNAVLVFVAQTPNVTFLMDDTNINMARRPRELEVQEIFSEFDRHGLLGNIDYCEKYLQETSELTPEEALKLILTKGGVHKLKNTSDFLKILSVHGIFEEGEFRSAN